jgi:hypothetical protein
VPTDTSDVSIGRRASVPREAVTATPTRRLQRSLQAGIGDLGHGRLEAAKDSSVLSYQQSATFFRHWQKDAELAARLGY